MSAFCTSNKVTDYEGFLRSKIVAAPERGIAVDASEINPLLKPHQAAIVRWALRKGNAAIFAAFGLGKTFMQLEIARLISRHTCEPFLITAPLGVRQEFRHDANMLGVDLTFIRETSEAKFGAPHIYVTNYESVREGKIDPRKFAGASLDEAAILRGFGGTKTFREFMRLESLETCEECGHIHLKSTHCDHQIAAHAMGPDSKPLCCECRGAGRLPVTFMLLQPQSWHPDVWTDITRMLSLNSAQSAKGKEMHLCPMQFDLADRAIAQFSMKGETVYDPFGGLGTVPLRALKLGRKGIGCELSALYFKDACFYLEAAERQLATPSLFDLREAEEEVPV